MRVRQVLFIVAAIVAASCGSGGGAVGCSVPGPAPAAAPPVTQADVPLIPRRLLFGNPERTFDKVAAQIQGVSDKFPEEILVALNNRNPELHDIYRVNIRTGARTLVQRNEKYAGFVTDDDYKVRFAQTFRPDGGMDLLRRTDTGAFEPFESIGAEDSLTTAPIAEDLTYLQGVTDGEVSVLSRTTDDTRWVVGYVKDNGPMRYYIYDRPARSARFLFTNRPALESAKLARMYPQQISKPLLIAQGANDPRVKQTESDQIVKAMQAKMIPVTYAGCRLRCRRDRS